MIRRNRPVVVIKLGGSLLDWPEWPPRLTAFLAGYPEVNPVLIVGGGRFADVLRDLDRVHHLGEDRSHSLALHVLDATAQVAAALLPGAAVVATIDRLDPTWAAGRIPIFAPRLFLQRDDRESPDPLPHAWTTTTDSIAARLAVRLGAAELVLLKSTSLPPKVSDWSTAAAVGLVDPEFPRTAEKVPEVRLINLKNYDTARELRG